ncbi:unnamed protein product [Parajaminaea phylloscopi]
MPVHGRGAFPTAPLETSYIEPGHGSGNGRDPRIKEYRALKKLPRADDALKMLRRIGVIVNPIMIRHQWNVPLLTEFTGSQKGGGELLGMNRNRGQVIYLRLREKGSDGVPLDSFLPEDDVVYTMLHELAHNVRGPHDEQFFQILKGLEEEWYELRRTGGKVNGDGFLTPGLRLGAANSRNLPPGQARLQALQKAEGRQRLQTAKRGGGKLGRGGAYTSNDSRTPAQAARDAAERRAKMVGGCPSTQAEQEGAVRWHEEEELLHGIKVIRILDDDSGGGRSHDHAEPTAPTRSRSGENGRTEVTATKPPASASQPITIDSDSSTSDDDDQFDKEGFVTTGLKRARTEASTVGRQLRRRQNGPGDFGVTDPDPAHSWHCSSCTLSNADASPLCQACQSPRPGLTAAGLMAATRTPVTTASAHNTSFRSQGSNDVGWKCAECGHWMLAEQASFWVCAKCSALARK